MKQNWILDQDFWQIAISLNFLKIKKKTELSFTSFCNENCPLKYTPHSSTLPFQWFLQWIPGLLTFKTLNFWRGVIYLYILPQQHATIIHSLSHRLYLFLPHTRSPVLYSFCIYYFLSKLSIPFYIESTQNLPSTIHYTH